MSLIKAYQHPINVFDNFIDRFLDNNFSETVTKRNFFSQPNVNIKETEDVFELELAVPGLNKEDFIVDIQNDHLTIKVEQKKENEDQAEGYKRREFDYTSFQRSFHLDKTINVENISATYVDGILKVVLPKQEKAKTSQNIEIN